MYSRNDYRYYQEGYLSHHGVLGMKWGIRRYQSYDTVPRKSGEGGKEQGLAKKKSKLEGKKASNTAKIQKYQKALNTDGAKKRAVKAAKYKAKQDKLDAKAAKARARLAKGKAISERQAARIAKAEKYRTKVAKLSAKNDKYQAKISQLEYKNSKLDKKLKNIDTKQKISAEKEVYKETKKALSDAAKRSSREYLKGKISDSDYNDLMDLYGGAAAENKALYKVQKAKIKNPDNFEKTYKLSVDSIKRQGASADDYIVTKADRKGNVRAVYPVWNSGDMQAVNSSLKLANHAQNTIRKSKKKK